MEPESCHAAALAALSPVSFPFLPQYYLWNALLLLLLPAVVQQDCSQQSLNKGAIFHFISP